MFTKLKSRNSRISPWSGPSRPFSFDRNVDDFGWRKASSLFSLHRERVQDVISNKRSSRDRQDPKGPAVETEDLDQAVHMDLQRLFE